MREVKIDGLDKTVKIRSIKRSEQAGGLDQCGYHLLFYSPPMLPDGSADRLKTEEGIDLVLNAVIGADVIKAVDDAGGAAALRKVWFEIIKETYGSKEEEKNLSPAGNLTPTPSGPAIASPAEGAARNA
jgi:hypothetical protein